MFHLPLIIIGGGVIGLSVAKDLRKKYPQLEFAIFEKENFLAEHTSGRNSGVLHAGIYYDKGSLKAKLCVEGNRLWNEWGKELNIPIKPCGKYIFARDDSEAKELVKIAKKAKENGALGIEFANKKELAEISEYVTAREALFSPSTKIIEVSTALTQLKNYLEAKDVPVMFQHKIESINIDGPRFILTTNQGEFSCDNLINAGGGFAIENREMLGLTDLENFFVKGCYLKSNQNFFKRSLLYPVPHHDLLGLGIHSTFDFDGVVRMGPNTITTNVIDYTFPNGVESEMRESIAATYKKVNAEKFTPDFCGVRPKIRFNGELHKDFWIKSGSEYGFDNYFELCGIESPGLTAAPAIASYLAKMITIN